MKTAPAFSTASTNAPFSDRKAEARMYRLGTGLVDNLNNTIDLQVALSRARAGR